MKMNERLQQVMTLRQVMTYPYPSHIRLQLRQNFCLISSFGLLRVIKGVKGQTANSFDMSKERLQSLNQVVKYWDDAAVEIEFLQVACRNIEIKFFGLRTETEKFAAIFMLNIMLT